MKPVINKTLSISVFSGKGGVGKSSLCANLGFCLSEIGARCLLMDCDLGLANLDVLLGVTTGANLYDLLRADTDAQNIILPIAKGLDLIPAASGIPELVEMDEDQRALLLEKLQPLLKTYDFLILDMAAGLNPTVLSLAHATFKRILVLTPEPTSLTDAYAMVKVLSSKNKKRDFLILVNQVQNREEAQNTFARLDNAVSKFLGFHLVYLGMVREDDNMGLAVLRQQALIQIAPQSMAAKDIKNIAQRIHTLRTALLPELSGMPVLKNF
ncbi:MAG TPA: MinD/ParA family protein [Desulfonatronum sp.]|nr:MinD/ParA family protein [Desulfonatronum sp.]